MIRLSERMQLMADMLPFGCTVADIGTDHGFLPIYLYQTNHASKIIMTDVADGPLAIAAENLKKYDIETGSRVELRKGSGLFPLQCGEVQTVIIAGMGGELIADILAADMDKARSLEYLILQPRTMCDKLRRFLEFNGFKILEEHLVREGPQIAQVFMAVPEDKTDGRIFQTYQNEFDFEFPPFLFDRNDKNTEEFVKRNLRHSKLVLFNLRSAKPDLVDDKIRFWERKKIFLEEKLSKI